MHEFDDVRIDEFVSVLIDCVEGGASGSLLHPLTRDRAVGFRFCLAKGVPASDKRIQRGIAWLKTNQRLSGYRWMKSLCCGNV